MANQQFGLIGGRELAAQLKNLPNKLSIAAVRKAGLKASRPMLDAARRNAPEDSGRLRRFLGRGSRWVSATKQVRIFTGLIKMRLSTATKEGLTSQKKSKRTGETKTVVNDPYYGQFVEEGTEHQKAQHWLANAFDETVEQFADDYLPAVADEIEKAVKEK